MKKRKKGKKMSDWNRFIARHPGVPFAKLSKMYKKRHKNIGRAAKKYRKGSSGGYRKAWFAKGHARAEKSLNRAWARERVRRLERYWYKAAGLHQDQVKKVRALTHEYMRTNREETRKKLQAAKAKERELAKRKHEAKKAHTHARLTSELPRGSDEHAGGYSDHGGWEAAAHAAHREEERLAAAYNDPSGRRGKKGGKKRKKMTKAQKAKLKKGLARYQRFMKEMKAKGYSPRKAKSLWKKGPGKKNATKKARKAPKKRYTKSPKKHKKHKAKRDYGYGRRSRFY